MINSKFPHNSGNQSKGIVVGIVAVTSLKILPPPTPYITRSTETKRPLIHFQFVCPNHHNKMTTNKSVSWGENTTRHRADDDVEALSSGELRTPNGSADLLDGAEDTSASYETIADAGEAPKPKSDKQARLEARLAKRTNKVMSAYKSYLAQIDPSGTPKLKNPKSASGSGSGRRSSDGSNGSNTDMSKREEEALSKVEEARKPYRDNSYDDDDDDDVNTFPTASSLGSGGGCSESGLVKRGWASRGENNPEDPPESSRYCSNNHVEDEFLDYEDIRQKLGLEEDGNYGRGMSYKHAWLRSKRVKRAMYTVLLVVAVIAIIAGVSKHKKNAQLPDWEKELAEVQLEEMQKKEASKEAALAAAGNAKDGSGSASSGNDELTHLNMGIDRPPETPETMEGIVPPPQSNEQTPTKTNGGSTAGHSTSGQSTAHSPYKDAADKYKPIAFDRSKGWDGQTYIASVEFCSEMQDHTICPYEAICPIGPRTQPAGGFKPSGSWIAISDSSNGWVHVGAVDPCVKYDDEYNDPPEWGVDGKEETTRYIMCCQITDSSPKVATSTAEAIVEEVIAGGTSNNGAIQDAASQITTQETSPQAYLDMAEMLEPVWYSRSHGWNGQTYDAAIEFCAAQESRVPCPYTGMCPLGAGKSPLGGIKDEPNGVSYAPIIDSPNSWVAVGEKGVCETYSSLSGGNAPEWGLTGENNEEMTRNVMCCKEPSRNDGTTGVQQDTIVAESRPVDSIQPQEPAATDMSNAAPVTWAEFLTDSEDYILNTMHPIWFGRKHGYEGTTHDDAVAFCKNVGGMHVCPLEAYCPNGAVVAGQPPLFLKTEAYEGEQWAPTNRDSNSWVLVGTSDGDPSTTCSMHEALHAGKAPAWGLDGTFTSMKENIMCCVDASFSAIEQVVTQEMTTASVNAVTNANADATTAQQSESTSSQQIPTTTSTSNGLDLEIVMQKQLSPLWLGANEGWNGGTHDDALAFCKSIRGQQLCPYSAYCPHGPGMPTMGRHKTDFNSEGEQYAPVFGSANHWVMIGQKDGNSATTCMSHNQLEGGLPDWGMSTDHAEMKKHILCCTIH